VVGSKAAWTFGVPQDPKLWPSAGSTITKGLGSSALGIFHGPL